MLESTGECQSLPDCQDFQREHLYSSGAMQQLHQPWMTSGDSQRLPS